MIEETDCEQLFAALPEDSSDPILPERLAWFTPPGGRPHLIALENLPRLEAAFGLAPFTATLTPFPQGTPLSRERLAALLAPLEHTRRGTLAAAVFHYLEGKALVNLAALSSRLGIGTELLLALLRSSPPREGSSWTASPQTRRGRKRSPPPIWKPCSGSPAVCGARTSRPCPPPACPSF
jgi:hypothetical protein